MKTKIKFVFAFFLLYSFMISVACKKQKAEWKGTIEEVNGVTVVKNPKEPIYVEDVFSLEEELSIGEAIGRKEYMFNRIAIAIEEDEEGYPLVKRYKVIWKI